MSYRFLSSVGVLGVMAALIAGQGEGQAPSPSPKSQTKSPAAKAKGWIIPRTPDGHPDLQGTWTNATLTPMERPAAFAGKATLTDAEASRV